MSRVPSTVERYAFERMLKSRSPAYFQLDAEGHVIDWGGDLSYYALFPPEKGELISEHFFFMEGLLPLEEASLELNFVQIQPGVTVDLHLFRHNGNSWLLILDAMQKRVGLASLKQRANELILKSQHSAIHEKKRPVTGADNPLLTHLLQAMDLGAMELITRGHFRLIGTAPQWLVTLWPTVHATPEDLAPERVSPFLADFLLDAYQFWDQHAVGRLESGIWTETDENGKAHLLQASALFAGDTKVLVMESERALAKERQAIIQKGRNLALQYHSLNRLEKKLQKARDDLEHRIRLRTAELESANAQLAQELKERKKIEKERAEMDRKLRQAQKMEAIGTLAGGIAHDFNNILSAVIGFTEIVLSDIPENTMIQHNLSQVLKAGFRAKDLVKQILTFSRQTEEEKKPVQVKLITHEALKLLRASLPSTIEIVQELETSANVMADPTQVHQIVMNLCTNAGHAMAEKGGIMSVSLTERRISRSEARRLSVAPGDYVRLTVSDTGHGMGEAVVERIFDPFFTTKPKDQGTGMGLSVVHGIIKSYGGAITVKSRPSEGTQFQVFLPLLRMAAPSEIKPPSALSMGTERILFIDDEPFQADMAGQLLARLGYHVTTRTDSMACLELFAANPDDFDLVITDMTMPKMTGTQLAGELLKIRPKIPIILCSGFSEALAREKAKNHGIRAYLMKPIVMEQMAATIRKVLDGGVEAGLQG